MGLLKETFNWLLGISGDTKMDSFDAMDLDSKLHSCKRVSAQWERDIANARKEYESLMNPDANLRRSSIERSISLEKAKMAAKRIATLNNAANMMSRLSGTMEQINLLRKFHRDFSEANRIPGGLSLKDFIGQVEKMGHLIDKENREMESFIHTINGISDQIGTSLSNETTNDKELESLFEKLQTLEAEGRGASEEAVQIKSKIDKMMGMPEFV